MKFTSPYVRQPGGIAEILKICYADLISSDPSLWGGEAEGWERFDAEVYENPGGLGDCTFMSWCGDHLIGFASYDPRQRPAWGVIGHNAVLPEFQGRGFGKQQIVEILRRFRVMGFKKAKVTTLDHPFFAPARAMYVSCGFGESKRIPWEGSPAYRLIAYEKDLA